MSTMQRTLAKALTVGAWGCLVGLVAGVSGCLTHARVNGEWVAREHQEYQGQPYELKHDRAYPQPGGPSSGVRGSGGTIHGEVCGATVYYTVEHQGDYLQLIGRVDETPADLRVREQLGGVNVAGRIGNEQIDLQLFNDRLLASIDSRVVTLQNHNDSLISTLFTKPAVGGKTPPTAVLEGSTALYQMPASVQGVLLPLMVHCLEATVFKNFGGEMPLLGFGGQLTTMPHNTLPIR